jgi:hypothetical protein
MKIPMKIQMKIHFSIEKMIGSTYKWTWNQRTTYVIKTLILSLNLRLPKKDVYNVFGPPGPPFSAELMKFSYVGDIFAVTRSSFIMLDESRVSENLRFRLTKTDSYVPS